MKIIKKKEHVQTLFKPKICEGIFLCKPFGSACVRFQQSLGEPDEKREPSRSNENARKLKILL